MNNSAAISAVLSRGFAARVSRLGSALLCAASLLATGTFPRAQAAHFDEGAVPGVETNALHTARQALARGEADKALSLLNPLLAQTQTAHGTENAGIAEAANLACRVHLAEQQGEQAAQLCGRAVALVPANSLYHVWLGRAYGLQAQHAQMFSAYGLARPLERDRLI